MRSADDVASNIEAINQQIQNNTLSYCTTGLQHACFTHVLLGASVAVYV
jgi:hypothetical protein